MNRVWSPPPPRHLHPATLVRTLVEATARALAGYDSGELTSCSQSAWTVGPSTLERSSRMTLDHLDELDPDAVAGWAAGQYPGGRFAGAVLGSPHGSVAHLAVAMGLPWLPTSFPVEVSWPHWTTDQPADLLRRGLRISSRLAGHAGIAVRQVHDPLASRCEGRTTHHCSWRTLPDAYRCFLEQRLPRGAPVIVISDARPWSIFTDLGGAVTQFGSPSSGLSPEGYLTALESRQPLTARSGRVWLHHNRDQPVLAEHAVHPGFTGDLRAWAADQGRSVRTLSYRCPGSLAAAIADVHRHWLRAAGKTGNRLVVECGRLVDAFHVLRAGLVPYWCERPSVQAVATGELWLAGSEAFSSIVAVPEPVGHTSPLLATLEHWHQLVAFATRRGVVDARIARAYPDRALAPRHLTRLLRDEPYDLPRPRPLTADELVAALRTLSMNRADGAPAVLFETPPLSYP
jgi:hypothetical protein